MRQHDVLEQRIARRVDVLISGSLFRRAQLASVRRRLRQMNAGEMRFQKLESLGIVECGRSIGGRQQCGVADQAIAQLTWRELMLRVGMKLDRGNESSGGRFLFFFLLFARFIR